MNEKSSVQSEQVGLSSEVRTRFYEAMMKWYHQVTFYDVAYYSNDNEFKNKILLDDMSLVDVANDHVHGAYIKTLARPSYYTDPVKLIRDAAKDRRGMKSKNTDDAVRHLRTANYLDIVADDLERRLSGELTDSDDLPLP